MKRIQIIIATVSVLIVGVGSLSIQGTAPPGEGRTSDPAARADAGEFSKVPVPPSRMQQLALADQVPKGLAASDWSSIRQEYEKNRHAAVPVDDGHQARNPGQQWQTRFDGRGFITQPEGGSWQWGLELRSYGFAGGERAVAGKPRVSTKDQRVAYDWDETLQEWFVNDRRGLEHGFTLHQRPLRHESRTDEGIATIPLIFTLAVRGGLRPEVQTDGHGVRFVDDSGAAVLNYGGLTVFDADGRTLPARFEPVEDSSRRREEADYAEPVRLITSAAPAVVRLSIDERGARYPLTIDPIAQQAYLKASENPDFDVNEFGTSVAVSGDTVVVGGDGDVYIFVRNGTTWTQQKEFHQGGTSVAVSGDTVVVGVPRYSISGPPPYYLNYEKGATYVYVRNGTNWSRQALLINTGNYFGSSVAVSGNTLVVGAPRDDNGATGVFRDPPDLRDNPLMLNSDAAYVFVRNGTNWTQQAYLKASNTDSNDNFGATVAVSGNTVVVGASGEDSNARVVNGNQDNNNAPGAGTAYVFVRNGTTWTQQAYLKASNAGSDDSFGGSVAISSDTIVVGAPDEDSNANGVNDDEGDNSAPSAGAAYAFVRNGTTWTQQAYLKASNTRAGDNFGESVAVSDDTVVVGAVGEDSYAQPSDDSAVDAGAGYVFVRSGATWSQQSYIKAFNAGPGDHFGAAVAVSGDTVVVGAPNESSYGTGVNSDQYCGRFNYTTSAPRPGAAYIFDPNGGLISRTPDIGVQLLPEAFVPNSPAVGSHGADFGAVLVGGSYQRTFTITNTCNGDLTGLGFIITGPNASDFSVTAYPTEPVSAGGSTTFTVRFSPAAEEYRVADLRLFSNDPDESPYSISLGGTGLTPFSIAQQAYIKASNTGADDKFGYSVAVSGDTVVVGAWQEDSSAIDVNRNQNDEGAPGSGAVYVFMKKGTTWIQQAYLKAFNSEAGDNFGYSVALSGNTLVIGAVFESSNATGVNGDGGNNSAVGSGAVHVFERSGTNWNQRAYLKASNTGNFDFFGYSVAISGDTIVVGAPGEDSNAPGVNGDQTNNNLLESGAAYVFVRNETTWSQEAYLKAPNTGFNDYFGASVGVSGNTVVVGAYGEDNGASESGAAYVFVRNGTNWSQQAYLKALNRGAGDNFGYSVAVWEDTVVVGAYKEDSSATGVNGQSSNNDASESGAAYIFGRSGTTWSQQAYLKSSNTGAGDGFGSSVAVSGNAVVVGAAFEDSSALGVNGNGGNDLTVDSGAAYVFVRTETIWREHGYLKASNTGGDDRFGHSVAVSGDTVVVGAIHEDSGATVVDGNGIDNSTSQAGAAYVFNIVSPEIAVTYAAVGAGFSDGSETVDFGLVLVGSSSSQTLYIENKGTRNLSALALKIDDASEFRITGDLPYRVLAPGRIISFTVSFFPYYGIPRAATLHIFNNDLDESSFDIELIGTGVTPLQLAQQAYLKPSNTDGNDGFGYSVAVFGDTMVVGAPKEDSNATGVNGNQDDDSASDSGAAYVFVRTGTN